MITPLQRYLLHHFSKYTNKGGGPGNKKLYNILRYRRYPPATAWMMVEKITIITLPAGVCDPNYLDMQILILLTHCFDILVLTTTTKSTKSSIFAIFTILKDILHSPHCFTQKTDTISTTYIISLHH